MPQEFDANAAVARYLSGPSPDTTLRASLQEAVGKNPDEVAQWRKTAATLGVPVDTAQAMPDWSRQQEKLAGFNTSSLARMNPLTAGFLSNPDNAAIAHDDVEGLTKLESLVSAAGEAAKYVVSYPGKKSTLGGDIAAAYHGAQSGAAGALGATARTVGWPLGFMNEFPSIGGNPLDRLSEGFMEIAGREAALAKKSAGTSSTWLGGAVSSGVQSLAQNAPMMLAAFLPGGQAAALTGMASMSGGNSYQKDIAAGVPQWQAMIHGVSDGVIEAGTELGPLRGLVKEMKAGTPLFTSILKNAWSENKGEQVATALQDLNDWAVTGSNQGKTFGDYLAARPEAAAQTAIATLIGAGGNITLMNGIQGALDKVNGTERKAQQAENVAAVLQELATFSAANKVRERDAETFEGFMQSAVEDGPMERVYVDPAELQAAGIDMARLSELAPSLSATPELAQALQDAIATGQDIAIPTAELMTRLPGSEFEQSLIPHLKTEPGGFSQSSASAYMQDGRGAETQSLVDSVLGGQQDDSVRQSADVVEQRVLAQLKQANRFTDDVNKPYAALWKAFFAVQSSRVGMTPEQLFERYNPKVVAQGTGGYEQGGVMVEQKAGSDFVSSKSDSGLVGGHVRNGALRISTAQVNADSRGKGEGLSLYMALIDKALADGNKVFSDSTVEADAVNVYEALRRRGYDVRRLEGGTLEDGAVYGKGATEPAFEIVSGPQLNQGKGARGSFNPSTNTIALFKAADLTSFLHESGHFFLEVMADLAVQSPEIGADFNTFLNWVGVRDQAEWHNMSLDEKRSYHEQFARGFEAYLMEGKAPNPAIQSVFSRFRAWLVDVYKSIKSLNVELSDEVRGVMDRMIATDEQIRIAEDVRGYEAMFATKPPSMTDDEWHIYQLQAGGATEQSVSELQSRSLKDLQWAQNAKSRALKAMQKKHDAARRDVMMQIRSEVMSEDVYRVWTFLTARGGDRVEGSGPKGASKTVNPEVDNLFEAIAKMGGIDSAAAKDQWGVDERDRIKSGLFGVPVLRKTGGLSLDAMAERLVEEGYIIEGANGQTNLEQFEALFDDQRGGIDRYSVTRDIRAAMGDAPLVIPELPLLGAGKLRTQDLRDQYGTEDDAVWRTLSKLRMTSDETGLSPEVVAQMFGMESGDELVQRLATAEDPKDLISRLTDQRMLENYGDLATPAGIERAAEEAIHNEARLRFVATEANALLKATGSPKLLDSAVRQFASAMVARTRVRDLRPGEYLAAERKAGQAASKAMKAGDLQAAAVQKRNQLINAHAAKAAMAAQDEALRIVKRLGRFDKPGTRKSLDSGYLAQIDQLLERFDLRTGQSLKAIDKRASLSDWLADQEKLGIVPNIPQSLIDAAGLTSYKNVSMEELRGLSDAIAQIEHMGRLKNRLMLARDKREFDAIATEMSVSIIENGGKARPVELEGPSKIRELFEGLAASHRKLSSLLRQMDGNRDDGPMYQFIGRAMNERGTMEDVMVEKATVALDALYAPMLKLRGGVAGWRSKVFIKEINASLTRGARLSIALNWGNADNRQRVMAGDNWTEGQVRAVLATLSEEELAFVNGVHEHLDSYWPEIADKEMRLTGSAPEKVEAMPWTATASNGAAVPMRGGYYPIKYDTDRSDRASQQEAAQEAKEMMQGAITRATTRRGHTKERAQEVKRAVRKDLDVITQHVTQVTHDLAWHEWLIDTNRMLGDERIVDAIRAHYGPKVLKAMRESVMGIAGGELAAQTDIDKAMLMLRSNVTRATMGASLTTAFLQPFGLTQSMYRIGAKHVMRGAARWAGDALRMENTLTFITGKSDFMRLRAKTFNKELREIRGPVGGKSQTMMAVDAGLFAVMQKMQMVADVPTWLGQYEKSMDAGIAAAGDTKLDDAALAELEASAVAMADRMVLESQGGGQAKDLAEVQRKHPMLTQFYSYFSVTLNLTAEATAATNFKNPRAVAGWLGDMSLLVLIPAILPSLLMHAIKGGGGDEPEDWLKRVAQWQAGYLLGMVVGLREFSSAISGFDYSGPPVGRIVGDIGKAGAQVGQGEADEPAVLALVSLMGSALGIPVVQSLRSYKGWKAWDEGKDDAGPQSVLFGPPSRD